MYLPKINIYTATLFLFSNVGWINLGQSVFPSTPNYRCLSVHHLHTLLSTCIYQDLHSNSQCRIGLCACPSTLNYRRLSCCTLCSLCVCLSVRPSICILANNIIFQYRICKLYISDWVPLHSQLDVDTLHYRTVYPVDSWTQCSFSSHQWPAELSYQNIIMHSIVL